MYKRALGEKTERAWEEYKRANKEAKRVVQEAKEKELVRCGKELQNDFLGNRINFWKKVRGKEPMHKWSLGIENEEGIYPADRTERS